LVEVQSKDLIADYIGGTAIKTNNVIDNALDGVLFIDEAYSLSEQERGGFGQEALETLLMRMEIERDRLVVICAGYPEKMDEFLRANPGLARRFPKENIIQFPDYSELELNLILEQMLKGRGLFVDSKMITILEKLVSEMVRKKDKNFGNAGEMRNLAESLERTHAQRVIRNHLPIDTPLTEEDLPENYRVYLPIVNKNETDRSWEIELDQLVGLRNVKDELRSLSERLEYEKLRYEMGINNSGRPQIKHFVFIGNPGTGKTTVARLVGRMYKSLGLLNKGHLIEVTRSDLVAGYVGQTALKTKEKIQIALDGVLFIDEAYALERGSEYDYGREAIEELVKAMEDYRERLVVVAAGYRNEMLQFLNSNPGLASRFGEPVEFEDLSLDELWELMIKKIEEEHYRCEEGFQEKVLSYIEWMKLRDGEKFGNGRSVRELFEKIKTKAAGRILNLIKEKGKTPTSELFSTLCKEDVPDPGYYLEVGPLATTKAIAKSRV
jgi:SpoVK/Ycf46/Vps4 family AAA+-type ATPase